MLIKDAVAHFDGFDTGNDSHCEHDFGAVRAQGHTVFLKIDAYDLDLPYHSPGPAVPRWVMTLMLGEECRHASGMVGSGVACRS